MAEKLRHQVIAEEKFGAIKYLAGVDVGDSDNDRIY